MSVCETPQYSLVPISAHVHRPPLQALGFSATLSVDLRFCRGHFTSEVPAGDTALPHRDAPGERQASLRFVL